MDANTEIDGFSLMSRTCQHLDQVEQQLIQANDRVKAYRQILIAVMEQLPVNKRIDIDGKDLLKVLADDI